MDPTGKLLVEMVETEIEVDPYGMKKTAFDANNGKVRQPPAERRLKSQFQAGRRLPRSLSKMPQSKEFCFPRSLGEFTGRDETAR